MSEAPQLHLALSIDHSKISGAAYELASDQPARIHAFSKKECRIYGGTSFLSLRSLTDHVLDTVDELETQTGQEFFSAHVSCSSQECDHLQYSATRRISGGTVSRADIQAIETALISARGHPSVNCKSTYVYGTQRSKYLLDDSAHSLEPAGLAALRLSRTESLFRDHSFHCSNLFNGLREAGIRTTSLLPQFLASGYAASSQEERQRGVIVIDIGHSLTTLVSFQNGAPIYSKIFPFGSDYLTSDLALCLSCSNQEAEETKQRTSLFREDKAKPPLLEEEVLNARMREYFRCFSLEIESLQRANFARFTVNLTGGGSKQRGLLSAFRKQIHPFTKLVSSFEFLGFHDLLDDPSLASLAGTVMCTEDSLSEFQARHSQGNKAKRRGLLSEFVQHLFRRDGLN